MKLDIKSKRALYELGKDSRVTSQNLGKLLKKSQQSVNYLMHNLERNGVIKKYVTVFDASKFGLINFVVLLRCKYLKKEDRLKILTYLKEEENVTHIERLDLIWDFLIIFSTQNISHFNKSLKSFLAEFGPIVDKFVILPIIVKYNFCRKYLGPDIYSKYGILFGDRENVDLSKKELQICYELRKNARESYLNISRKIKIDPKTVVNIKKNLEKKGVISSYSIIIDHTKAGIRRFILLLKLKDHSREADKRFTEYCRNDKYIVSILKTLGEWDVILEVEFDKKTLTEFLEEFREKNSELVEDYITAMSNEIIKSTYLPDSIFG